MGMIKVVLLSGFSCLGGIYTYRSVNQVNQVVQRIKVPNYTLLGNHKSQDGVKEYKDAYRIELPRQFKLVQGTGSSKEISATDVAKAFFTCKVFTRFERRILERVTQSQSAMDTSFILNYKAFRFKEGDSYLVWTVEERYLNEILLKWEYKGLSGTTWFCVPVRENVILFGSSFPRPDPNGETPSVQDFISSKPKQLFIDAASNLPPPNIPLSDKIRNFCLKTLYTVSVPVHQLYSKYLLSSTLQRLMEMKDKDDGC